MKISVSVDQRFVPVLHLFELPVPEYQVHSEPEIGRACLLGPEHHIQDIVRNEVKVQGSNIECEAGTQVLHVRIHDRVAEGQVNESAGGKVGRGCELLGDPSVQEVGPGQDPEIDIRGQIIGGAQVQFSIQSF